MAKRLGQAGYSGVICLECSLSMLRHRMEAGQCRPTDPLPTSTLNYLHRANQVAEEILAEVRDHAAGSNS